MATLSLLCGILFWAYIWNKWYRPRKPKPPLPLKTDSTPWSAEEREAIYGEVLLQVYESGESIDAAKIAAEATAQLYDKSKAKPCADT